MNQEIIKYSIIVLRFVNEILASSGTPILMYNSCHIDKLLNNNRKMILIILIITMWHLDIKIGFSEEAIIKLTKPPLTMNYCLIISWSAKI